MKRIAMMSLALAGCEATKEEENLRQDCKDACARTAEWIDTRIDQTEQHCDNECVETFSLEDELESCRTELTAAMEEHEDWLDENLQGCIDECSQLNVHPNMQADTELYENYLYDFVDGAGCPDGPY